MPANWLPVHKKIRQKIKTHDEIMLAGGAGSSKTWTLAHVVCLRALLLPGSRHLCLRKRFEHAKVSLWNSIKEMINLEWAGLYDSIVTNRSGGSWILLFPNGSEVHVGGMDDKERIEKWLGSEWATIYINEASEIMDVRDMELVSSRLRQKIDGRHLLLLDMNPPAKSHWSYKRYVEEEVEGRCMFKINPIDVKENLPPSYLNRLNNLPERLRQRFLYGEFTSDIEGALWSWEMIESTRKELDGETGRIVIGVDPAGSSKKDSDETGIVVAAQRGEGMVVMEDRSGRYTPAQWSGVATELYHKYRADAVVCEVNYGGEMVEAILRQQDRNINVIQVRATRGKHIRASPISQLYERGLVQHEKGLDELEEQMMSWVPGQDMKSPDRLDSLVWAATNLMIDNNGSVAVSFV
jgi:phage terminase large subunit-like protein